MTKILINADDYGLHRNINEGILECVAAKKVNSISVSSNGHYIDWDQLIAVQKNGVFIGAHITLVGQAWGTNGWLFNDWRQLLKGVIFKKATLIEKVEEEVEWQLDQFKQNGIRIQHIDSHQHVHVFPRIWPIIMTAKNAHNIPRVRTPFGYSMRHIRISISGLGLHILGGLRNRQISRRGLPCIGIAHAGHNDNERYKSEMKHLPKAQPIEFVVHPGKDNHQLNKVFKWNYDWDKERLFLLSELLNRSNE